MEPLDPGVFRVFAEALAIGLLIGSERYRGKSDEAHQTAGMRTFTVIALLGACAGLIQIPLFSVTTFAAVASYMGIGYYRNSSGGFGLTTEMTALLTFWLGYLMDSHETLAISTGIVVAILLASKESLHEFIREQVSEEEFFATLKFLAVVFVVFPLLPNRYVGPFDFVNPTQVWMLIILISAISYSGYILIRLLGARKGLTVSALLGGIVSTTAVTLSLAQRARQIPALGKICGVTGVMANAAQFPRLLVLVWIVDSAFGRALLVPMAAMALTGLLGAWVLNHLLASPQEGDVSPPPVEPLLENPFSLWPVLKFGALFVGVFFVAKAATVSFGDEGLYVVAAFSGLASVSAIALSVADMLSKGTASLPTAMVTVLIALAANGLSKWLLAYMNGTRELAFWLGGGFLTMLGTGTLLIGLGLAYGLF